MIVRNRFTKETGFIQCFNWNQGRFLPVFIGSRLVFWKQEDTEIIHDRPAIAKSEPVHPKVIYKDPFEHYTENELNELWNQNTGYEICKRFVKRIINFINVSYFRQDAQDY